MEEFWVEPARDPEVPVEGERGGAGAVGPPLRLTQFETAFGAVVEVTGRLTGAGAPALEARLARVLAPTGPAEAPGREPPAAARLILDLRRLEAIDAQGLSALARVRRALPGRPLAILLRPGSQPERVVRLAGFELVASLAPDLPSLPPDSDAPQVSAGRKSDKEKAPPI